MTTVTEPDPTQAPPRVFISYSHDSDEHADRVLALSDSLRAGGLDVVIDQYDPNPPQGWPLWMQTNLDAAQFVLMVCTETYHRRVMRQEKAGKGLGVQWEGSLIYNDLYQNLSQGARYVPILFDAANARYVPGPTQGHTFYHLTRFDPSDPSYEALYRHLTGQHGTPAPALGTRQVLPPKPRGVTPPNP